MWKSICLPNFDEIHQFTPEIKLLPVSENGRPPYWNSISGFDFDVCIVIGMSFYICLPNFVVIERQMQNDMPMTIHTSKSKPEIEFQNGGRPFSETGSSFISAVY